MKLYAARHGETTWNVEGRTLGSTPGELTEQGKQQAAVLGEKIKALSPDRIYAADLKRHMDTIGTATRNCPEIPVIFTDQLRERNFGELEGKLRKEVDWDGFWAIGPDDIVYGAESLSRFVTRIAQFITTLPEAQTDKTVVLLTSIGVLNRLRCLALDDPYNPTFTDYTNAELIPFDFELIAQHGRTLL